jgi:hypothetical protein
MIGVLVGPEPPDQEAPGPERSPEFLCRSHRVDEMLEDVHGGDHVEALARQPGDLEVEIVGREPTLRHTPAAEVEQGRADIGGGHLEAVPREQDESRPDAGAEVQTGLGVVAPGIVQGDHIGERGQIVGQRMPPRQLVQCGLALVVETLDGRPPVSVNAIVPFALQILDPLAAA